MNQIVLSLTGGALIGLAASLHLIMNGRVTGISGILNGTLEKPTPSHLWRYFFILGLLVGGASAAVMFPEYFINSSGRSLSQTVIAGLLVGYGTVMANGCTSGHGVCGISRLSPRSLVATITFMFFGFLTANVVYFLVGG